MSRALIIGGGAGGIAAALALVGQGHEVHLFEGASRVGGKANTAEHAGVEFDTGPSLLTLVDAFTQAFAAVGERLEDVVELRPLEHAFRYLFPDGVTLDFFGDLERTHAEVRDVLGPNAAADFSRYLRHSRRIWEASADTFVFGDAPTVDSLRRIPAHTWRRLGDIDALRSLGAAIDAEVRDPHLRTIFRRYATYNGSDPRRAPATNACITHVELGLGAYGVKGGISGLLRTMASAAETHGVHLHLNTRVERIALVGKRVIGLETSAGFVPGEIVVSNAETRLLFEELLPVSLPAAQLRAESERSTSAWNAVFKAVPQPRRAAHTVVFPREYPQEFGDLFDRHRVPREPTVYLCDQRLAHEHPGWLDGHGPVFAMVNAPSVDRQQGHTDWDALSRQVRRLVAHHGLIDASDEIVWRRRPRDLARTFPGSGGSLYGASSSSRFSAFLRVPNRVAGVRGLYVASGTAHPGGGVPLCVLSGLAAARAVARDLRGRPLPSLQRVQNQRRLAGM